MIEVNVYDKRMHSLDARSELGDVIDKSFRVDSKELCIHQDTELGYRVRISMTHDDLKELSTASTVYLKNLAEKRRQRADKKKKAASQ